MTEAVKWHLLGVSISINNYMPTFINKYQKLVVGVAPSKEKLYKLSFMPRDSKASFGGGRKIFLRQGYDFLVPKNWSMETKEFNWVLKMIY